MSHRISRQALYDLVWSEPMKTLATRFGVSDVALAKTCHRAAIPVPERGYWARRQAGKPTMQPDLVPRPPGLPEEIVIGASKHEAYYCKDLNPSEQIPVTLSLDTLQERRSGRNEHHASKAGADRLRLLIQRWSDNGVVQLTWQDSDDRKLEDQLEEVAVEIVVCGEHQYREKLKRHHTWLVERKAQLEEEARRRKTEEERKKQEREIRLQKERVERLLTKATALQRANEIRAYVEAVRRADLTTEEQLAGWSSWALEQADRIDPIVTKAFLTAIDES